MATIPDEHKNLDHIYLLGWYDQAGRAYLSTWEGDAPIVNVVITGVTAFNMPLWKAAIPPRCTIEVIPPGIKDFVGYATERMGFYAFGWYNPKGIDRPKHPNTILQGVITAHEAWIDSENR